jgi:hypothetical protein
MNEYRIGMYILISLLLCGVFGVLPICISCLTYQPDQNCYLNLDEVPDETIHPPPSFIQPRFDV